MSRLSRRVVLVATLASLCGALSSSAAVTWTNDGATAFTATGLAITPTTTGTTFTCGFTDVSGTAPAVATTLTYTITATAFATSCTFVGSAASYECGYTFTATSLVTPVVTGTLDMTCGFYVSTSKLCHWEGSTHAQYTNETGTLTGAATSQLRVTGASCPFGNNGLADLPQQDFKVSSANPPTITRAS